MKILLVEDNEILSNNIYQYLRSEKIECTQLFTGKGVNYELSLHSYDLIILDIGLPDKDGFGVCEAIRESGKSIPILILTARNGIKDKVLGFQLGADDYLTKPFNYEELLMRIHALIRRNFSIKSRCIQLDGLEIHPDKKKVFLDEKELSLSNKEFMLLVYLAHNKGRIVTKSELFEKVWGEYDAFNMTRTLDVHIGYLRKKLGRDLIETVRGEGYIIN